MEDKDAALSDPDVERQVTAIRANCDLEIESLLMGVRLLRSYFNEEQLRTPVLQFFEENLPNVSVVNENDGKVDLKWKHQEDIHASLLRRMSMAHPNFSELWQPFSGFPFPSTTGLGGNAMLDTSSILSAGNHAFEDSFQSLALGLQDGFHTPGANSQRMSIGMTPKTQRQPKPGEILLSIHGSPLGVFQEDNNNMEAIIESEEG